MIALYLENKPYWEFFPGNNNSGMKLAAFFKEIVSETA
jgi:hypothetical protein